MRAVSGEGAILITGSTGFIGRHVTRRLYQAGRRVIALARSQGGVPGTNRLKSLLGIPAGDNGLEMIESDLTQPGAGLGSSEVARLRANVHTVIHCAGDTSFFPQITADSRAIFIDAPLALLQALRPGRLERWCQLSTAFVCGRRGGAIFESEGTVGQKFHNPYEEIKLESEIALKEFCARFGIDLRILRPSVVIGPESSTQGGSPSSLLYQFIRLAATLSGRGKRAQLAVRIQGRPSAHFNIVPRRAEPFTWLFPKPPTQAAMLQMITSRLGANGLRLIDERHEPMLGVSSLENRVARMLSPYREYLEQDVSFDDSAARSLLGPAGITCSRLDEKTIDDFVAMALSQPCHRVPARSRRQERSRA